MLFLETIAVPLADIKGRTGQDEPHPDAPGHHMTQEQVLDATKAPIGKPERSEETGLMQALEKMINYNRESKEIEVKKREEEKMAKLGLNAENGWHLVDKEAETDRSPALSKSFGHAKLLSPSSYDAFAELAYPELWAEKEDKIRKLSPFGKDPNWRKLFG